MAPVFFGVLRQNPKLNVNKKMVDKWTNWTDWTS